MSTLTKKMREKYQHAIRGVCYCRPAGGVDVVYLCDVIELQEQLIRRIQRFAPVEVQNDIEAQLRRLDR